MDDTVCSYCGSDVTRHDPVRVEHRGTGGWEPAGRFCNYACLHAHIEAEKLVYGSRCEWRPD